MSENEVTFYSKYQPVPIMLSEMSPLEGRLQNLFYEARITLIQKPDKDTPKKEEIIG